jgi:hypothetical protein
LNRDNQQERLTTAVLSEIPNHVGWYLSGFSDGEGSFNISFRKKSDYKISWQPVLSFNVSQRDITVLQMMKQYFQCGIIKRRKDGLYSFDVTTPKVLGEIILPFFHKYPFFSESKKKNFSIFEKAVQLMVNKRHLEYKGLLELIDLRELINEGKGRKRKYTKANMLLESPETIR